jgi:hypothetical protein
MEEGEMRLYQEGLLGSLLSPRELLSNYRDDPDNSKKAH